MTHQPWIDYWSGRALPMLQRSHEQLQPMLRRAERVRPADVVDLVLRDPLLTAQVLRVVNQRMRSSLSADIVSIDNALQLFGTAPFLDRFSRMPVLEDLILPGHPQAYERIQKLVVDGRFAARLTRDYANRRMDARLDEVFIAALMACVPPILYTLASTETAQPPAPGAAHELFGAWRFPEAVLTLMTPAAEGGPRVVLQHSALRLAHALDRGWWQNEVQTELATLSGVLAEDVANTWATARKMMLTQVMREPFGEMRLQAPRWLPMLPGEWPRPSRPATAPVMATLPTVEVSAAPPPRAAPQTMAPAAPITAAPAPAAPAAADIPVRDVLAMRMQALHLAGKQGATAQQLINLSLRALVEGLNMKRAAFLVYVPADQRLQARLVQSADPHEPLRDLVLTAVTPHLFTRLLSKPQAAWLHNGTRAEIQPLLPAPWLQRFGSGDFCAMSLFMGAKPIGIFVGERPSDDPLADGDFASFKQVCLLVGRALTDRSPK
ncbi:HDOD domain protein [Amantichitinum ursilacus]|uniref:HDOD domain protein n=2 Tax=Amantichitinum ursilacus TaxID=857265 RepID=A0A0N0GR98_9NEIS|nr:HDOD domain protein [Amantichitinum ursilacus]